jgi:glycosyltransferase involved in cell wall biosynthesis
MPARIRGRVEVVVHGIHLDGVRAADGDRQATRAALGFDADDVVCLTVANLRREKGYDDLLDAARIVLDRCPRARFLAAGQGPLEAELAARHAELRLGDRFRFLGYRTDVPTLLAAADLFVLASHHEGLPVALMEALASGLPVVATAVGGVPEAVHDGVEGVLVPAGQPDTLADAVLALVADPGSRARMGRAARARAEDYDVSRAAARIEEVYRAVARP